MIEFRQIRLGKRSDDMGKNNLIEVLAGLSEAEIILMDPVRAVSLIKLQNIKEK